ncbi:hypothetical protein HELRODRAFT_159580 [Helobdella robusta]|uniref:Uncharacterized protein n=1 Tax=Helobdella robusta TaxID=6412 RepID=T1EP68_HELRO|nr:hypothetical protein HELRODRAFT_159580 [Helobdella robusta]ESO12986.1 hypothetical protein HELRODRAFT_159580 [Helobdella robusta]
MGFDRTSPLANHSNEPLTSRRVYNWNTTHFYPDVPKVNIDLTFQAPNNLDINPVKYFEDQSRSSSARPTFISVSRRGSLSDDNNYNNSNNGSNFNINKIYNLDQPYRMMMKNKHRDKNNNNHHHNKKRSTQRRHSYGDIIRCAYKSGVRCADDSNKVNYDNINKNASSKISKISNNINNNNNINNMNNDNNKKFSNFHQGKRNDNKVILLENDDDSKECKSISQDDVEEDVYIDDGVNDGDNDDLDDGDEDNDINNDYIDDNNDDKGEYRLDNFEGVNVSSDDDDDDDSGDDDDDDDESADENNDNNIDDDETDDICVGDDKDGNDTTTNNNLIKRSDNDNNGTDNNNTNDYNKNNNNTKDDDDDDGDEKMNFVEKLRMYEQMLKRSSASASSSKKVTKLTTKNVTVGSVGNCSSSNKNNTNKNNNNNNDVVISISQGGDYYEEDYDGNNEENDGDNDDDAACVKKAKVFKKQHSNSTKSRQSSSSSLSFTKQKHANHQKPEQHKPQQHYLQQQQLHQHQQQQLYQQQQMTHHMQHQYKLPPKQVPNLSELSSQPQQARKKDSFQQKTQKRQQMTQQHQQSLQQQQQYVLQTKEHQSFHQPQSIQKHKQPNQQHKPPNQQQFQHHKQAKKQQPLQQQQQQKSERINQHQIQATSPKNVDYIGNLLLKHKNNTLKNNPPTSTSVIPPPLQYNICNSDKVSDINTKDINHIINGNIRENINNNVINANANITKNVNNVNFVKPKSKSISPKTTTTATTSSETTSASKTMDHIPCSVKPPIHPRPTSQHSKLDWLYDVNINNINTNINNINTNINNINTNIINSINDINTSTNIINTNNSTNINTNSIFANINANIINGTINDSNYIKNDSDIILRRNVNVNQEHDHCDNKFYPHHLRHSSNDTTSYVNPTYHLNDVTNHHLDDASQYITQSHSKKNYGHESDPETSTCFSITGFCKQPQQQQPQRRQQLRKQHSLQPNLLNFHKDSNLHYNRHEIDIDNIDHVIQVNNSSRNINKNKTSYIHDNNNNNTSINNINDFLPPPPDYFFETNLKSNNNPINSCQNISNEPNSNNNIRNKLHELNSLSPAEKRKPILSWGNLENEFSLLMRDDESLHTKRQQREFGMHAQNQQQLFYQQCLNKQSTLPEHQWQQFLQQQNYQLQQNFKQNYKPAQNPQQHHSQQQIQQQQQSHQQHLQQQQQLQQQLQQQQLRQQQQLQQQQIHQSYAIFENDNKIELVFKIPERSQPIKPYQSTTVIKNNINGKSSNDYNHVLNASNFLKIAVPKSQDRSELYLISGDANNSHSSENNYCKKDDEKTIQFTNQSGGNNFNKKVTNFPQQVVSSLKFQLQHGQQNLITSSNQQTKREQLKSADSVSMRHLHKSASLGYDVTSRSDDDGGDDNDDDDDDGAPVSVAAIKAKLFGPNEENASCLLNLKKLNSNKSSVKDAISKSSSTPHLNKDTAGRNNNAVCFSNKIIQYTKKLSNDSNVDNKQSKVSLIHSKSKSAFYNYLSDGSACSSDAVKQSKRSIARGGADHYDANFVKSNPDLRKEFKQISKYPRKLRSGGDKIDGSLNVQTQQNKQQQFQQQQQQQQLIFDNSIAENRGLDVPTKCCFASKQTTNVMRSRSLHQPDLRKVALENNKNNNKKSKNNNNNNNKKIILMRRRSSSCGVARLVELFEKSQSVPNLIEENLFLESYSETGEVIDHLKEQANETENKLVPSNHLKQNSKNNVKPFKSSDSGYLEGENECLTERNKSNIHLKSFGVVHENMNKNDSHNNTINKTSKNHSNNGSRNFYNADGDRCKHNNVNQFHMTHHLNGLSDFSMQHSGQSAGVASNLEELNGDFEQERSKLAKNVVTKVSKDVNCSGINSMNNETLAGTTISNENSQTRSNHLFNNCKINMKHKEENIDPMYYQRFELSDDTGDLTDCTDITIDAILAPNQLTAFSPLNFDFSDLEATPQYSALPSLHKNKNKTDKHKQAAISKTVNQIIVPLRSDSPDEHDRKSKYDRNSERRQSIKEIVDSFEELNSQLRKAKP